MSEINTRFEFLLRDPSALGALLEQDWRVRSLLTDDEVVDSAVDQPLTTAVLRHLQRLGFTRAVHGVREQGGRMRLWSIQQVLRIQTVLELRAATGVKLAACTEALVKIAPAFDDLIARWEECIGSQPDLRALQVREAPVEAVLDDPERLSAFAKAAITVFVTRHKFEDAPRPAFLL